MDISVKPNRFLKIDGPLLQEVRKNLLKEVDEWVETLSMPGTGEQDLVLRWIKRLQETIGKFCEFGWSDVKLLDETIFPELAEAIGVLKRGGLQTEAKRILGEILSECNLPKEPALPPKVAGRIPD